MDTTKRTRRPSIALTEAEYEQVRACAAAQHIDIAAWLRRAAMLQVARERSPGQTA